ncbi:MAG: aspartyl protease family protein, partial [Caulobacteraceae bacterium]
MRRLILPAILALLSATGARAQEKHCQLQSLGEMPASVEHGEVITEGDIDGKPVHLIVDTGSFGTLLFETAARKMGLALRPTGASAYGVGGEMNLYSARVKEFRLGALSERNADLVVGGGDLGGAQGLVGAKFLLQADVEFDLPHGKIRFFKPRDCQGDQVVYWGQAYAVAPMIPSPDDRIVVEVKVGGARVVAQMDTGASASVLTPAAAALAGVTPRSA